MWRTPRCLLWNLKGNLISERSSIENSFFFRLVTVGVEIVISSSLYRDIFDEISAAGVAAVRLQIVESQREVHRSIAQAELYVVDAKAIHAFD